MSSTPGDLGGWRPKVEMGTLIATGDHCTGGRSARRSGINVWEDVESAANRTVKALRHSGHLSLRDISQPDQLRGVGVSPCLEAPPTSWSYSSLRR